MYIAIHIQNQSFHLLQVAYVDSPIVKDHTGEGLALSWKSSNEYKGLVPEQIHGWSTDGQYHHLHVFIYSLIKLK